MVSDSRRLSRAIIEALSRPAAGPNVWEFSMAATKTLISADEFFALGGSAKQELVAGEVIEMVPPGGQHGGLQGELIFHLRLCLESSGTGVVLGEAGFRLKMDPDTVRAPDVAYLSAARLPEDSLPRTYIVGARSEEHTSELQSRLHLVCRLLLEKK